MRDQVMSEDQDWNVVVNDEEQYSIWPCERELPPGWREAGFRGLRTACLEWIEREWTDMRPRSLRERMAADAAKPPETPQEPARPAGPSLVDRLCAQEQSAYLELYGGTLAIRLEQGLVHVCLPDTRGGTTLGVSLVNHQVTGESIQFLGTLSLDFVTLRCHGQFDLSSNKGQMDFNRQ